jgi:hypothetical protein
MNTDVYVEAQPLTTFEVAPYPVVSARSLIPFVSAPETEIVDAPDPVSSVTAPLPR